MACKVFTNADDCRDHSYIMSIYFNPRNGREVGYFGVFTRALVDFTPFFRRFHRVLAVPLGRCAARARAWPAAVVCKENRYSRAARGTSCGPGLARPVVGLQMGGVGEAHLRGCDGRLGAKPNPRTLPNVSVGKDTACGRAGKTKCIRHPKWGIGPPSENVNT